MGRHCLSEGKWEDRKRVWEGIVEGEWLERTKREWLGIGRVEENGQTEKERVEKLWLREGE